MSDVYTGPQTSTDYWPPDYIGVWGGRGEITRLHDTCPACRTGDHSAHMTDRKCLRAVDPVPWDYVCLCEVKP